MRRSIRHRQTKGALDHDNEILGCDAHDLNRAVAASPYENGDESKLIEFCQASEKELDIIGSMILTAGSIRTFVVSKGAIVFQSPSRQEVK